VDVVLDLMIHDLDIVLTFAASPVREVRAVGLPILSPKVDIANVRVEFESGCVANFTASRVSTERVRKLRFFEPRQYVSIDYARQDLLVIGLNDEKAAAGVPAGAAAAGLSPEIVAALAAGKADPALLGQLAAAGKAPFCSTSSSASIGRRGAPARRANANRLPPRPRPRFGAWNVKAPRSPILGPIQRQPPPYPSRPRFFPNSATRAI
jgi:hypothetical protein